MDEAVPSPPRSEGFAPSPTSRANLGGRAFESSSQRPKPLVAPRGKTKVAAGKPNVDSRFGVAASHEQPPEAPPFTGHHVDPYQSLAKHETRSGKLRGGTPVKADAVLTSSDDHAHARSSCGGEGANCGGSRGASTAANMTEKGGEKGGHQPETALKVPPQFAELTVATGGGSGGVAGTCGAGGSSSSRCRDGSPIAQLSARPATARTLAQLRERANMSPKTSTTRVEFGWRDKDNPSWYGV